MSKRISAFWYWLLLLGLIFIVGDNAYDKMYKVRTPISTSRVTCTTYKVSKPFLYGFGGMYQTPNETVCPKT